MRELALFSGGGGGILGSLLSGFVTICAVEIVPKARGVLLRRQAEGYIPTFPIWDDVATFDGRPWRDEIDVITGGFPCTDISCAGKGAGITGKNSGLFFEMLRIIEEVRPRYVFSENAKELRTKGLGAVIKGFTSLGYVGCHGVLGARHFGANHHRKRMWIVAADADQPRERIQSVDAKMARSPASSGIFVQSLPGVTDWWDIPRFARVDDGGSNRLDIGQSVTEMEVTGMEEKPRDRNARVVMTGNMQVPAVVAAAWDILSQSLEAFRRGEK